MRRISSKFARYILRKSVRTFIIFSKASQTAAGKAVTSLHADGGAFYAVTHRQSDSRYAQWHIDSPARLHNASGRTPYRADKKYRQKWAVRKLRGLPDNMAAASSKKYPDGCAALQLPPVLPSGQSLRNVPQENLLRHTLKCASHCCQKPFINVSICVSVSDKKA